MKTGREFILIFGKYRGETLEEIYIQDVGYLEWLKGTLQKKENKNKLDLELETAIQNCFKEMRNVRICS